MRKKLLTILVIIIGCIFALQLNTFAVIVSTDKEVASGSGEVTVTVTSNKALGAYTLKLTNTGGLTLVSASGGQVSSDKKTITNSSDSGLTTLGSFTFQVPTVSSDTTYNVKFSITGMETPDLETVPDESNTAVVKVKGSNPTPTPEPTPDPTPTKSSDTSLKSLSISPFGKINKASSGIYDITVENSLEKVTISAVPNHSNAKVTSGNGEFSLEEGTNNFKVVVKAEDGTEGTHKIRIIRKAAETTEPISPPNVIDENKEEEKPEEDKNDELGLTNLVVTGIELNPKFSADVYEYKAEFSEDIDTLEILATPNIEGATVEIVGNSNLKIGENLITIMVKSKDGETTKTYQIMVNKNEPEVVAPTAEDGNTAATSGNKDQELKSKIGKIILIAAAAVIAVILLGIIAIVNTKKKSNESVSPKAKKETFNKNDFRVAVNEEESYKELEKLSNIHNRKNIFENAESDETENQINDDKENISFEELSIDQNNQEIFEKEDVKKIDNVDDLFAKENSTDNVMKEVTLNVIPDTQTEISKSKKTKGKRFK